MDPLKPGLFSRIGLGYFGREFEFVGDRRPSRDRGAAKAVPYLSYIHMYLHFRIGLRYGVTTTKSIRLPLRGDRRSVGFVGTPMCR
jgi:hypothetical protein